MTTLLLSYKSNGVIATRAAVVPASLKPMGRRKATGKVKSHIAKFWLTPWQMFLVAHLFQTLHKPRGPSLDTLNFLQL